MTRKNAEKRKKWTPGDISKLRKIYPDKSAAEVAKDLGKSIASVRAAAYVFGLKKTKKRPKFIRKYK